MSWDVMDVHEVGFVLGGAMLQAEGLEIFDVS
jgi:hypothetical protein